YVYNGSAWVKFGATVDHGNLIGLADDDHLQYLLVSGARAMSGNLDLNANDINNIDNLTANFVSAKKESIQDTAAITATMFNVEAAAAGSPITSDVSTSIIKSYITANSMANVLDVELYTISTASAAKAAAITSVLTTDTADDANAYLFNELHLIDNSNSTSASKIGIAFDVSPSALPFPPKWDIHLAAINDDLKIRPLAINDFRSFDLLLDSVNTGNILLASVNGGNVGIGSRPWNTHLLEVNGGIKALSFESVGNITLAAGALVDGVDISNLSLSNLPQAPSADLDINNYDIFNINSLFGVNLSLSGGVIMHRVATASNYNVTNTDYYVGVTDTSVVRTITLLSAARSNGKIIYIKDESGGAATNNITIVTEGAETIDGANNYIINVNYGAVQLICDGTNWFAL
ncbi:hypothetical protein DRH14_03920, partial [Candidatus Shapirobacteria bacterium]